MGPALLTGCVTLVKAVNLSVPFFLRMRAKCMKVLYEVVLRHLLRVSSKKGAVFSPDSFLKHLQPQVNRAGISAHVAFKDTNRGLVGVISPETNSKSVASLGTNLWIR